MSDSALRELSAARGLHRPVQSGVLALLERWTRVGRLELTLPDGTARTFGEDGELVRGIVTSPNLFRRLGRSWRMGFGESYAAGEWHSDDLVALFTFLIRNAEEARLAHPRLHSLGRLRPRLPARKGLRRAHREIAYHYDLGNDLYRLFLDESLTYSCALWEPGDTLARAQARKLARIADKLELGRDDHVLEIGCGWGSFALEAARRGARVTGVTISRAQHELASARVREAGLAERVEIRFQDYRTLEGSYTKIASIEMLEAIGYEQFDTFFRTCDRLLARGGAACVQTILIPDQRFDRYRRAEDWMQRYVFPGSLLPSLTSLAQSMTRVSELSIHGVEEIGVHYARTLREWRERFLARRAELEELGYDERFRRIWEFYLAYSEALFATRAIRDAQLVLRRAGDA